MRYNNYNEQRSSSGSVGSAQGSPSLSVSPSPYGNGSAKRRSFGPVHTPQLSARGINPDRHPELHAKEMTEMKKLVAQNCDDSAAVISRTEVECLWCNEIHKCPPYRPQNFYFRDLATSGMHDGHYWTCTHNPNNQLQAGRGVPVGEGKILI
mmetsp:Transcript_29488/g.46258  ORF Transcript_29488/g.46258 Transcript_29488/m.46258 type:complete len:152 (+) Transcript_29488:3-458(+)